MNINELILFLREELKEVKFDEILNHLPLVNNADIRHIEGRQISEDVIDIDIDTGDTKGEYADWTVTLRRIVNWYPMPKEYITINRDAVMADNVEVFQYHLEMECRDVKVKGKEFVLA